MGEPGTIIGWHLGHIGPQIAAMLPGWRYIAAPTATSVVSLPTEGALALVGYSLGCSGLRDTLMATRAKPEAVEKARADHDAKAAEADRLRAALERLG